MIPKPKKQRTINKEKEITWEVFSLYIRLRDCMRTTRTLEYGHCITCNKRVHYKEADAGHFINRWYSSTLFDERNFHLQCKRCIKMGGEPLKYRRAVIRLYGERVDEELEQKSVEIKQFTRTELLEMREEYQRRIKKLKGEL